MLLAEALRRRRAAGRRAAERRNLAAIDGTPARLARRLAAQRPEELLDHFRSRTNPRLWADRPGAERDRAALTSAADLIAERSEWELAGFGRLAFVGEGVWRRDPLGHGTWSLDYHADVPTFEYGRDIRVLWELNRFGHALTLACAYALTGEEKYAETFFSHVESWIEQNPYGRGANWNCAMEVALRAVNLLAAFEIFRSSQALNAERLSAILKLFDQHGRFIVDNSEFTYLVTSNHYLSDVVGLFWIGTLLPELEQAAEWRDLGLSELLREMDKQVLPDGADFEASSGYHRFVTEMLLVTFVLADRNGVEIGDRYRQKLRAMLGFLRGIAQPGGRMPLFGDCDGTQFLPITKRRGDEAKFLLDLGAVMFAESSFQTDGPASAEVGWLYGSNRITALDALPAGDQPASAAFADAGIYVLREDDLYLLLNAGDCGIHGRGSHGHNDALSIEVAAFGRPFIVDPGSYCYNLDREARHEFRSTAYHSTVVIDGAEQNSIRTDEPFVIGNEATPYVIEWQTFPGFDVVEAGHCGYRRLATPVTHKRTVEFNKAGRYWIIEDFFEGSASHSVEFRFHLAPGLSVVEEDGFVRVSDGEGRTLLIGSPLPECPLKIEDSQISNHYGHREPSQILVWAAEMQLPAAARFALVPAGPEDEETERLELLTRIADNS